MTNNVGRHVVETVGDLTFKGALLHQEMWSFGSPTFSVSYPLKTESRRAPRLQRIGCLASSFICETVCRLRIRGNYWHLESNSSKISQTKSRSPCCRTAATVSTQRTLTINCELRNASRMRPFASLYVTTAHAFVSFYLRDYCACVHLLPSKQLLRTRPKIIKFKTHLIF